MKELKTLNDFIEENYKVDYDELKAEAVKWVKARGECEASDVLIDLFNLTEDDLNGSDLEW